MLYIFDIIGWVGSITLSIVFIPQIVQTYRTKRVDDISFWMCLASIIGCICMIIYGWSLNSLQMLLVNSISCFCSIILAIFKKVYKT